MPRVRRCRAAGCHKLVTTDHWYCEEHRSQEAAYLEHRAKWARTNDKTYRHKYNTVTRGRSVTKREQYEFYHTKTWQALRQQALERDNHLCQYCMAQGRYTPGNTVDHIVPIEYEPSTMADINNLTTCCPTCHKAKTKWEQSYYGTGSGNTIKETSKIDNINLIVEHMIKFY